MTIFRTEEDRAAKRKSIKNKGKTDPVSNNGFNPVWKQRFHFEVRVPSLAFLEFRVKDHSKSGRDNMLGAFSSPLTLIKEGTLHYYKGNFNPTRQNFFDSRLNLVFLKSL